MKPKKVLAFDIGGTSIRGAIVENNKILRIIRRKTPKSRADFLKTLDEFTKELLTDDIKGIGVGCAGVIRNGIVKNSPNLPITNFDLKKYFKKHFKGKVEIFNDAGCFSIAEKTLGCKKKDFFILTLGTGIGGGLIIGGEPYSGGNGFGGELGHIFVNGLDFEKLWKRTRDKIKIEFRRDVLIKDLVKMDYHKAKDILVESADYLGKGLASIVAILDPEIIILAGGPSESGSKFIAMIQKSFNKYNFLPGRVTVRWTKLTEPGILGASLLVS